MHGNIRFWKNKKLCYYLPREKLFVGKDRMRTKKNNELKHLIYFSKPTVFDYETIKNILTISRMNNSKTGLTGSLIYRSDLYFQFLEGSPKAVHETYKKIKLDIVKYLSMISFFTFFKEIINAPMTNCRMFRILSNT